MQCADFLKTELYFEIHFISWQSQNSNSIQLDVRAVTHSDCFVNSCYGNSEKAIKMAESEVKRFQKDRILDTKNYMISFVQKQIKISRETEYLISGSILRINLINFDCLEKKVRVSNMKPRSPETSTSKEKSFSWPSSFDEKI